MPDRSARVLVVTDHPEPTEDVLEAIRSRAERGPAQFRVLIPNPARAEASLRHPERHERADRAERVLLETLPAFEQAAGCRVIGSVSIRNDPYDAVEELMLDEPIDEIVVALAPHGLSRRLHLDLAHRLAHFGLPVSTVSAG